MKVLRVLGIVVFCFSCAPIYLPNARNVPMLSKAGEVQGSLQFVSGYNLQAALAVSDHVGIMANGMYSSNKSGPNGNVSEYSFGEFGVGYYTNTNNLYFDIFGGYGIGKTSALDSIFAIHPTTLSGFDKHLSSANYNRIFIQPSFGLKLKHFEGATALRFSILNLTSGFNYTKEISFTKSPVIIFEPAFVAKFPFEKVVLFTQIGLTMPVNKAQLYFDYEPLTLYAGIGFRLGYLKQK